MWYGNDIVPDQFCCPLLILYLPLVFFSEHLKGQLFCEGPSPDALVENARTIRKVAVDNGIDVADLMVIDNCNCPNIPYLPGVESKCDHLTAKEYFSKI